MLELAENHGFAGAVNAGIAHARGEFVALLNNDMELDPGWLAELVAALDADPAAGSAASKLRMLREPGVLDGAGDVVTWYGATWRRGHGEPDRGQYDEPGHVASPCAGAALYRRRALEEVGCVRRGVLRVSGGRRLGPARPARGLAVPLGADGRCLPPRRRHEPPHGRPGDRADRAQHARAGVEVVPGGAAGAVVAADRGVPGCGCSRGGGGSWRAVLRGWSAALRGLPATLRARAEVRRRTREPRALAGVVTARIVRRGR